MKMRDLTRHPVSRQELMQYLRVERQVNDPDVTKLVGDMSPIYLEHITEIVKTAFELCDGFERRGFVIPFTEATRFIIACNKIKED